MTSKIVVNNIEADSGINTVTFNSNIQGNLIGNVTGNVNTTGVSTFSNIRVTGGTISGVSTAGITTVYTNSVNGGQLGGSRNIIINGSMVVNQRGFTGAAGTTTNDSYPIDRFKLGHVHDGVVSAGQTTMNSTVGGNAYADGFNTALFFKVTTADASLGASQYQVIRQLIEGYNVQGIKKGTANAQPVTLSFWVRSNTTGTYVAELEDVDNVRTCSQAYTINAANTWEKKTLTYPADTTGVFDNDNASSLFLNWWLAAGSNFTGGTLQTTWASTTQTNRAVGITNLLATAGNDFFLTGVQLEVGDRATEFERRSYGDELRLCQRYCWVFSAADSQYANLGWGISNPVTSNFAHAIIPLPVHMRTKPTSVTVSSQSHFSMSDFNSAYAWSSMALNSVNTTPNVLHMEGAIGAGSVQSRIYIPRAENSTSARLTVSAEL